MWPHVDSCIGNMWDTRYPHVFAGSHMCLTCEKSSSHVGKRVRLEQPMLATCEHMWATYEHMWATCGCVCVWIKCGSSVGA